MKLNHNEVQLAQLNSFGGLGMFASAGDEEIADEQAVQYGGYDEDPTAGLTQEQIAEAQAQAEAQA